MGGQTDRQTGQTPDSFTDPALHKFFFHASSVTNIKIIVVNVIFKLCVFPSGLRARFTALCPGQPSHLTSVSVISVTASAIFFQ